MPEQASALRGDQVEPRFSSVQAAEPQCPPVLSAESPLPLLLTASEAATLLRTSRKGLYSMIERGQLPGITRIGRRVLIRTADLLDWLRQKSAPSPKE
jgi:excisionase family DNA binding protein